MASKPLVSCLMPTANRRAFVPQAIHYFQRQDYPFKELVILDDGGDPVEDLIPRDSQIRYFRLSPGYTLGVKRNLCVEVAKGDLLMHWDDDDWMAIHRIRYQVDALLERGAEICGLRQMLFYDPLRRRAWRYHYPGVAQRPWLAGGSLLYTRDCWRRARFPDVAVGEDTRFVWMRNLQRSAILEDIFFYVALIHAGNSSPKRTTGACWEPMDAREIVRMLGEDDRFYRGGQPYTLPKATASGAVIKVRGGGKSRRPRAEPTPPLSSSSVAAVRGSRVTVSIPYYRTPATLRRAVESILRQTYTELRLVVVNDGDASPWHLLSDIDDARLVRFDLGQNRGRYFADAVVLAATEDPYFLVQDADDWSEPDRIATLLRALRVDHAAGAVSAETRSAPGHGNTITEEFGDLGAPLSVRMQHRANHHGLFRTDALRAIGGFDVGLRIGYDTLLINLLLMTGRLAYVERPLYHRLVRRDSLTNGAASGMSSAARRRAVQQLCGMYARALQAYNCFLDGTIDFAGLCAAIRATATGQQTGGGGDAREEEARRLRELLSERQRDQPSARANGTGVVQEARLPWDAWSIGPEFAEEVLRDLEELRPRRLVEVGGGVSTVLLADWAARHGARVVCLEHSASHHARTRRLLDARGLAGYVDLRLAPLMPFSCPDGQIYPWYDTTLEGPFDLALVDGPPETHGRQAALFALLPALNRDGVVWLHDGARRHEQQCIDLWSRHLAFSQVRWEGEARGAIRLMMGVGSGEGLGVTVLTGGRPRLLRQTIEALLAGCPGMLQKAAVVVLVNGDDAETTDFLRSLKFVDACLHHRGGVLPIGVATSRLMTEIVQGRDVQRVLHLEDDWIADGVDAGWLSRSAYLLSSQPAVGQVRLRRASEAVLSYHMLTRRRIIWQSRGSYRLSPAAHYTFNPSLIRAQDAARLYPCRDEREAQSKFLERGFASIQLVPGVFRHGGESQSRRAALGR